MTTQTVPALVVRRTYSAPIERVFEAWTDPEIAIRFLGPNDVVASRVAMDARPGGSYAIDMAMPDGEKMTVGGIYREVVSPTRLVMTWRWVEDDPSLEHESLLTIELAPVDGGTELTLTHERLASEESRAGHERGWNAIADELASVLSEENAWVQTRIAAPRERVFAALTGDVVTRWWVRSGVFDTREWSGDVRVGGTWHASGIGRGAPYTLDGQYLEIESPRRLVHTWQLGGMPLKTTVTYDLVPDGDGGTIVRLIHGPFPAPELREANRIGWETSFDALRKLL